ncbi:MAG: hypothetical protein U1E65_29110 [Myxococcota bacterium]
MRGWLTVLLLAVSAPPAGAQCFQLAAAVTKPLQPPPTQGSADSGERADGVVWARLRARVDRPIRAVLEVLRDPAKTPDPSLDALEVETLPSGPHLARLRLHSVVRPFPLVSVEWTEELAIDLLAGSPQEPEAVLLSYQKTAGTSHIEHLCGSTLLTRVDASHTEVYQYEESKITGRDVEDQAKSLSDFLSLLRTKR